MDKESYWLLDHEKHAVAQGTFDQVGAILKHNCVDGTYTIVGGSLWCECERRDGIVGPNEDGMRAIVPPHIIQERLSKMRLRNRVDRR
jgi:hypothetical protein